MDDGGTLWPIHDDQFEQVPGSIWPDDQEADRVFCDLLDHQGVTDGMIDVLIFYPVASSRGQHIHTKVSYYETDT
jgi:hypothetical protein